MKFNELTIRELHAQAKAACIKAVCLLDQTQLNQFDYLSIDYVSPETIDVDGDFEYFSVLGTIGFDDLPDVSFKANLAWFGDGCDLAGTVGDSIEILD